MRAKYGFLAVSAIALPLLAVPIIGRVAVADPPKSLAATAVSMPVARGGIRYDPSAPLNVTIKPKFDEKNPPPLALTYAISYKGGEGATIPGLFTVPTGAKGKVPCVIVQHGLGGRKEEVYLLSAALAKKGYAGLFIDIAGHGERPKINGKSVSELDLPEMRTMVGQTVADLRRAMDFLATRSEVDGDRIGYLGASLGGIIGGVFIGDEPRVRAAVLWAAGGNWGKLVTQTQHQFAKRFQSGGKPLTESEVAKVMADVDPVSTISKFAPRPLLFINGDKDNIVPTGCTDELCAMAMEPKKRITLPGGHVPDLTVMINETMSFLDANMKPAQSASISRVTGR